MPYALFQAGCAVRHEGYALAGFAQSSVEMPCAAVQMPYAVVQTGYAVVQMPYAARHNHYAYKKPGDAAFTVHYQLISG